MARLLRKLFRSTLGRGLTKILLALLIYLLQVCAMPYVSIGGVTPSLIIVMIAVMTVGFGRMYAFWTGACYGILLECMSPATLIINLLIYPISALLCSLVFSDKSHQQLELERNQGKSGRNTSPLIRTPLCCAVNSLIYNTVNIAYVYLRGTDLTVGHIGRGLLDILLTTALCVVLMLPMRYLLGLHYNRIERARPIRYEAAKTPLKGGRI